MKRFTPGVKSIPIVFSMLDIDDRSLPKIDTTAAFVHNFVPITKRESFWERFQGTMGKRVKEDVKREKANARKEMKKDKEALSRRELAKSNSVKE